MNYCCRTRNIDLLNLIRGFLEFYFILMLILFLLRIFIQIHERRLILKKKKNTKLCYYYCYYTMLFIYLSQIGCNLKVINKKTNSFLVSGTITGIIMTYYFGFLFTIIVNSIIWYVISYLVNKYYYKSKGVNDQKYLIQYGLSKIKSRNKRVKTGM